MTSLNISEYTRYLRLSGTKKYIESCDGVPEFRRSF